MEGAGQALPSASVLVTIALGLWFFTFGSENLQKYEYYFSSIYIEIGIRKVSSPHWGREGMGP